MAFLFVTTMESNGNHDTINLRDVVYERPFSLSTLASGRLYTHVKYLVAILLQTLLGSALIFLNS